jgi:recombination protein RecA
MMAAITKCDQKVGCGKTFNRGRRVKVKAVDSDGEISQNDAQANKKRKYIALKLTMRPNLAALRSHVELSLTGRVVSPFGYRDRKSVETVLTGIPEIDSLAGGFPRGALTEVCGPPCSGRTTLLLSALAARTAEAEVCALIDARDSFDPRSAEAAGVQLQQLLWVRCRSLDQSLRAADLIIQGGGFGFIALDLSDVAPETVRHVPLNAWFRFRRAVEDTATVLLLLEQESNAKTCASLVLHMNGEAARWSETAAESVEMASTGISPRARASLPHARLLDGADARAEMLHTRIQSINVPQARAAPVSIAAGSLSGTRSGDRDSGNHRGDSATTQSFSTQSIWSYLRAVPVEAQLK